MALVVYYRARYDLPGLNTQALKFQRETAEHYSAITKSPIIAEFTELEGKGCKRRMWHEAVRAQDRLKARLVVPTLDPFGRGRRFRPPARKDGYMLSFTSLAEPIVPYRRSISIPQGAPKRALMYSEPAQNRARRPVYVCNQSDQSWSDVTVTVRVIDLELDSVLSTYTIKLGAIAARTCAFVNAISVEQHELDHDWSLDWTDPNLGTQSVSIASFAGWGVPWTKQQEKQQAKRAARVNAQFAGPREALDRL